MMIFRGYVEKFYGFFLHIKYFTKDNHLSIFTVYFILLIYLKLYYLSTKHYFSAKLISLLYFQNKIRGKVHLK